MRDLPFQKKGVRRMHRFSGRVLLADEMGLGKTRQTLRWLSETSDALPTLIICPSGAKWVWEEEIRLVLRKRCSVLDGRKPPKRMSHSRLIEENKIFVINYDILDGWLDWILAVNPQTIILDEVHYIKNPSAIRTKTVRKIARHRPYVIAISGTPLLNRPSELWTTINLVRPDVWDNIHVFRWRYCDPVHKPWGWEYKGATHIRELHRRLRETMMVRRRKKDVLSELPPKTRRVVPLDIHRDNEYEEAVNHFLLWLRKKSKGKAERASKAEHLTQMGYLTRLAATLKMKSMIDRIDSFLEESDGKLVVVGIHRKILNRLRKKYKTISVQIDGRTPKDQRKRRVKKFQKNKNIRLLFGQIKVIGVALTLTAADTLAFAEMSFVPGLHLQAEDRIHRLGTKKPVEIWYWVAKGTIEEKLCRILQEKQSIITRTLDKEGRQTKLNVWNELVEALSQDDDNVLRKRKIK